MLQAQLSEKDNYFDNSFLSGGHSITTLSQNDQNLDTFPLFNFITPLASNIQNFSSTTQPPTLSSHPAPQPPPVIKAINFVVL